MPLNESPSEKEGKSPTGVMLLATIFPSMKVPPKRKGNVGQQKEYNGSRGPLNESPSEKEGKYRCRVRGCGKSTALNESPSEKEGKSLILRENL